jgi:adenylate cyclase, class 2
MGQEIEMKFKVGGHQGVARQLQQIGARMRHRVLQTDRYFDTPARRLLKGDCGLRLRQTHCLSRGSARAEERTLLTFKGPRRKRGMAKIRPEYQTYIDDPAAMVEVFAACGLNEMLAIQKKRTGFRVGRCMVELDELPLLGCFVEIEGPDEHAVQAVREKLDLTEAEPLKEHYINLARSACRRLGKGCGELTFAACKRCRGR